MDQVDVCWNLDADYARDPLLHVRPYPGQGIRAWPRNREGLGFRQHSGSPQSIPHASGLRHIEGLGCGIRGCGLRVDGLRFEFRVEGVGSKTEGKSEKVGCVLFLGEETPSRGP